jgi:hypothetical protein
LVKIAAAVARLRLSGDAIVRFDRRAFALTQRNLTVKIISTLAAVAVAAASTAFAAEAPKIAAIRAQLYFERTGTFSDDVLASGERTLFNTIIGEGGAGAPSNFTLVTVEVAGKDLPIDTVKVQITARGYKRKIVGQRTVRVAIYDEATKFHAPLFLHDTGCDEIEITARLIVKGAVKETKKKVIPFLCGE